MGPTQESFLSKLFESIIHGDFYILLAAIFTGYSLYVVICIAKNVDEEVTLFHKKPQERFAKNLANRLNSWYNFFTTMITIFPLLGMYGTVRALIQINLSGEMDSFRQEFFGALTSTAWGIIFAIIFKVINSIVEYRVISKIEAAEKLEDEKLLYKMQHGEQSDEKR